MRCGKDTNGTRWDCTPMGLRLWGGGQRNTSTLLMTSTHDPLTTFCIALYDTISWNTATWQIFVHSTFSGQKSTTMATRRAGTKPKQPKEQTNQEPTFDADPHIRARQMRQFRFTAVCFMPHVVSSSDFIQKVRLAAINWRWLPFLKRLSQVSQMIVK